jgi:hypothetical protein
VACLCARKWCREVAHLINRDDLANLIEPVRLRAEDLDLKVAAGEFISMVASRRGEMQQTHLASPLGSDLLLGSGRGSGCLSPD